MATFYRIVKTNPPTVTDFLTDRQARRRPPPLEVLRLWDGRSVFDSEAIARDVALRFPVIGSYIAALDIAEDGTIVAERTLRRPGHYTLWGDTAAILARVVAVVPV
ncbi:MAG: hypothetical protein ACRDJE_26540 [Dehalococcoidia bacterium]